MRRKFGAWKLVVPGIGTTTWIAPQNIAVRSMKAATDTLRVMCATRPPVPPPCTAAWLFSRLDFRR